MIGRASQPRRLARLSLLFVLLHGSAVLGATAGQPAGPEVPSEERQRALWRYAISLGAGRDGWRRPSVRVVQLRGPAAYSDLEHGEVQLDPVQAFAGIPRIVELYLAHEYLHFVLHQKGIPAPLHHCWMARNQTEFHLALDFVARVREAEAVERALVLHANRTVRTWRRQCQHTGVWWHSLVLEVEVPRLAN